MIEEYLSERQKKKKRKQRQWRFVIAGVVAVLLVVGSFWFLFRSPVFQVRQVVIRGNSAVASSDIATLVDSAVTKDRNSFTALLGMDNMLAWPNKVASADVASIPQLADLALTKDYWDHDVVVTVQERVPVAIWCEMPPLDESGNPAGDESCYWFDDTGIMFEPTFDTEGTAILAVHDYSPHNASGSAELMQTILPDEFVPNLISILNVLKQSGLNIKEIALNDLSLEEIDVSTYDGPSVYFSLRFSADEDLPVLESIMAKPGFGKLQYIDFRVENRAYYQ